MLHDAQVSHAIGVQRIASSTVDKVHGELEKLASRVNSILAINQTSIRSPSKRRLAILLQNVKFAVRETYNEITKIVMDDVIDFVDYEIEFQGRMFEKELGIPIGLPPSKSVVNKPIGRRKAQGRLDAFDGVTIRAALRSQESMTYQLLKKRIMTNVFRR